MSHPSDSNAFVQALKAQLHDALPDVKSSHLSEAIAVGLGFETNASFLVKLHRGLDHRDLTFDVLAFNSRLHSLGASHQTYSLLTLLTRHRPISFDLDCIPVGRGLYDWSLSHAGEVLDFGRQESSVLDCIACAAGLPSLLHFDKVNVKFKGYPVLTCSAMDMDENSDGISHYLDDYFERRRDFLDWFRSSSIL